MTYWDVYQNLLGQLDHQDELISARTQWLVTSQMLLFVAYFCIDKKKLEADPPHNHHRMVSALGMVSTIFILAAVLAAVRVWVQLRGDMLNLFDQHSDLPVRRLHRIGIGGALLCSVLLPIAILFVWTLLTFPGKRAAVLITISGLLLGLCVIGASHEFRDTTTLLWFFGTTLTAGIVFLFASIWVGVRSVRRSSVP